MSAQHTPGPWIVCVGDGDDIAYTIFAEHQLVDGRIAADRWDYRIAEAGLNHENFEANARLIAAAPELLTRLRDLCDALEFNPGAVSAELNKARAAIAKAIGSAS